MRAAQVKDNVVVNVLEVASVAYPVDGVLVQSDTANIGDLYDGFTFSPPPADVPALIAEKFLELNAAYKKAMDAGFVSTALGSAHWYATDDDRKAILANAVVSGADTGYGCYAADASGAPTAGTFAKRLHTPAQMLAAVQDAKLTAEAYLDKLMSLLAQAAAATTEAEVGAINW